MKHDKTPRMKWARSLPLALFLLALAGLCLYVREQIQTEPGKIVLLVGCAFNVLGAIHAALFRAVPVENDDQEMDHRADDE